MIPPEVTGAAWFIVTWVAIAAGGAGAIILGYRAGRALVDLTRALADLERRLVEHGWRW